MMRDLKDRLTDGVGVLADVDWTLIDDQGLPFEPSTARGLAYLNQVHGCPLALISGKPSGHLAGDKVHYVRDLNSQGFDLDKLAISGNCGAETIFGFDPRTLQGRLKLSGYDSDDTESNETLRQVKEVGEYIDSRYPGPNQDNATTTDGRLIVYTKFPDIRVLDDLVNQANQFIQKHYESPLVKVAKYPEAVDVIPIKLGKDMAVNIICARFNIPSFDIARSDNRFTGAIREVLSELGGNVHRDSYHQYTQGEEALRYLTVALGDSGSDIPMFKHSAIRICVSRDHLPSPKGLVDISDFVVSSPSQALDLTRRIVSGIDYGLALSA